MGTSADVLVGATGKVYGGVTGTPLPTTAAASLNAAFKDLGYVSDGGVTQKINQSTNDIKAWGGSTVRRVQTDHTVTYDLVLIETNPDAVAAYYGTANFDDTLNRIELVSAMNERKSWIVDVVDGINLVRVVIPDGEVTAHADVVFKTGEAIGYGLTITAYEDAAGVKAYEYLTAAGIS